VGPLINPKDLLITSFADENRAASASPSGTATSPRTRTTSRASSGRPSYFIDPLGHWGKGRVELVELPTREEIHDNVVAYWVPAAAAEVNKPVSYSYVI